MISMPETILLGDLELEVVQIVNLTEEANIPEKNVDKQYTISDHVILEPPRFSIDAVIRINSTEYSTLKTLYEDKELITFSSDYIGAYDDMIIESLSFRQGGSLNTLGVRIQVKQVRYARSETVTINLPVTPMIQEVKRDTTIKQPVLKETPRDPVEYKTEEKGWLDAIVDFLQKPLIG